MFNFGGKKRLNIHSENSAFGNKEKFSEEKVALGWERQRLSKSSGKQIRTRFGKAVVK